MLWNYETMYTNCTCLRVVYSHYPLFSINDEHVLSSVIYHRLQTRDEKHKFLQNTSQFLSIIVHYKDANESLKVSLAKQHCTLIIFNSLKWNNFKYCLSIWQTPSWRSWPDDYQIPRWFGTIRYIEHYVTNYRNGGPFESTILHRCASSLNFHLQ